jgi:hypothetical protein
MDDDYQFPEELQENKRIIKNSFIKRHLPVLIVVFGSFLSLSLMSYTMLGGSVWRAKDVYQKKPEIIEKNLSYQELVEEDKRCIRETVGDLFGKDERIYITQYSPSDVETMKFRHKQIGASRGNLFVQIGNVYYYLSGDGKRLYYVRLSRQGQIQEPSNTKVREPEREWVDTRKIEENFIMKERKREEEEKENKAIQDKIRRDKEETARLMEEMRRRESRKLDKYERFNPAQKPVVPCDIFNAPPGGCP